MIVNYLPDEEHNPPHAELALQHGSPARCAGAVSPSTRQEVRNFIRHYYPVEIRVAAKLIGQQAKWHWE
jgi:hypothetical protein